MIQQAFSKITSMASSEKEGEIIVLILKRKNSAFRLFIENSLKRMEDEISNVEFHFIVIGGMEVKKFMFNYGIGQVPAILFFTKEGLIKKIEESVSTVEFESTLKLLMQKNGKDNNKNHL